MRIHYKFGLLLIFLLLISKYCTHAAPTNQSSSRIDDFDYKDEYDDDDDYYSEDNDNSNNDDKDAVAKQTDSNKNNNNHKADQSRLPTLTQSTSPKSTNDNYDEYDESKNESIESPKRSNHVLEPKCPKRCICLRDFKYIQCTNSDLTQIPYDIPVTATQIDLSQNRLSKLEPNDLLNLTKLVEINLSYNQITDISKELFTNNQRLKKINLSNNLLQVIPTDAFASVPDLETLDLSNNSIALPENEAFLNQPRLLELSCRNCTWTMLFDETFENLSSLTALRLDQNDFNKKINTKAFKPLRNLIKLRLPALDQPSVTELCSLLKAIDNISFRHFDVSCYELVLGYSYNESLIQTSEPPFQQINNNKVEQTAAAAAAAATNSNNSGGNEKEISTKMTTQGDGSAFLNVTSNENVFGGVLTNSTLATAGIFTNNNATQTASTNSNDDDKTYQVPVSPEAINIMLICIMIIAVVGLAIGLACRKDVGGIKTKCCRTNKAEPKDEETQPAEEIPLNKLA